MAKSKGGSKQSHPQPQSAKTGKFIKDSYAKKHPDSTFTEKRKGNK